MRKLLIFFIIINSISSLAQNSVDVNFNLCKIKVDGNVYENEYKIIFNDSLTTEFNTKTSHNLPDGKYRIEYKTFFGWKTTNSFLLFDKSTYFLIFCIDKVDSIPIDIYNLGIDSIKDGEVLEIIHNYSGCFTSGGEKITIRRIKNKYVLIYNNITRKLKKREIDYLKTYEVELINLKTNEPLRMCTTFSQNTIQYENHTFTYSENCPKWNGFEELKSKLKLQ